MLFHKLCRKLIHRWKRRKLLKEIEELDPESLALYYSYVTHSLKRLMNYKSSSVYGHQIEV